MCEKKQDASFYLILPIAPNRGHLIIANSNIRHFR